MIAAKMDENVRRRMLGPIAFMLSLVTLVLALTTLLTGITGTGQSAAILTLNTSSLGLREYHERSSTLYANITALVPSNINNPPSITRYLGTRDWYTMHYFSNCSGFFAPSTAHPYLLTSTKVNATCHRQFSGYPLNLHDIVQASLLPSVRGLADTVSAYKYETGTWSGLWYGALGNGVVAALELPWTFTSRRPWLFFWIWWNTFTSSVLFLSSSAMVTNTVVTVYHAKGIPGPNPSSGTFLAIMWSTTILMSVVCGLMWVQWRMEGRGQGQCYVKGTRQGSEMPLVDWQSKNTVVGSKLS